MIPAEMVRYMGEAEHSGTRHCGIEPPLLGNGFYPKELILMLGPSMNQ